MKQVVVFAPEDKKKEIIKENEKFNIPLVFIDSIENIEKNIDNFVIFYPPLVVNDVNFIDLVKRYPVRTFNPICDLYVFDFETTMMLIELENFIPDNPDTAEVILRRFLKM